MKYMGSKARHAKELLPIILADRKPGQWYVEPFVGGANMIDKVAGPRIGSDANPYLMALWQGVAEGWTPPDFVSEDDYRKAQQAKEITAFTGYVGFAFSFGGKFFGGYRRDKAGTNGCRENMATQSRRSKQSLEKQIAQLRGVQFVCASYDALHIPPNSIVYCDPPYAGTTGYKTGGFDHIKFWAWCDRLVVDGHKVFVSEYAAPDGWRCVWQKQVNNTLVLDSGAKQGVEKLFTRSAPC